MIGIKSISKISATLLILVLVLSTLPMGQVNANGGSTIIGYEDFDGGAVNLLSTANVFDYGAGGGSLGDVFGRVSAFFGGGTGMPWDVADDSAADVSGSGVSIADNLGLAGQNTTAFFAMNDMDGGDGPGLPDATWTFDISSASSITDIQIDLGALGDFEASSSDGFMIEARVDANPYQTIFEATTDESAFKTYREFDGGFIFSDDDPLQLFIDGAGTPVGFLDKSDPVTGNFDSYISTLLAGQSGSTLDIRVSWGGTPSGSEPMGIDNITVNGATAPVVLGYEDFDGGAVNLLSTANVFDYGAGGGSLGDVFGRVSAFFGGGTGMPWDVADDSAADVSGSGVSIADNLGLAGQNTTAFFAMNDMDGGDGPGLPDATWTFDISSASSITDIQIDLGALGDFEASSSDGFMIEARVDANPYQTIFEATTDESAFKTYREFDGGFIFSDDDPLQLFIDGAGTPVGFLDKSDPVTGNFDSYISTLLAGQSGSTLDIRVSWGGTPSGSEPMGIDNITVNGATAPVVLGYEDFDGGAVNLLSTANVFDYGAGGGSLGDVFGRVSAFFGGGTGMPWDVADDSAADVSGSGVSIADNLGLAGQNTTAFFAMNDMDGGDGPGLPDATWTFDISSASSITDIQIDLGALGDFEASSSDGFMIEARVDANPYQTIFEATTDESSFKTYREFDGGFIFSDDDPLQLFIDGAGTPVGFLDKSDPVTGNFDSYISTLLAGQSGSTLDIRVSWDGTPSGSEPMGIDNITVNGVGVAGNVPPTVVNTDPSDGAEYVNVNSNIEIIFSEAVTPTGAWFEIVCDATILPAVASGGPTSYTLAPTSDLPSTAACTVTVLASQVKDQGDPPLNMEQDYSFGFTTNAVCGDPATLIHAVQGPGAVSPITIGQIVTVEGVVVGDFQESDELNGFFVQEENADFDGDVNTSEGLFIFEDSYDGPDVNEGDLVRVTGQVDEYYTLTELNNISNVLLCEDAPGPYGPVDVTLPEATDGDLEKFEGMYVNLTNTMSVAQNYFLGRYGQLTLSSDLTNRLYQPTNQELPNTPESSALAAYNARSLLFLDDGVNVNTCGDNPVPVPYLGPAPPTILRGGDHVSNLIGVLDYGQINSGSECWVPSTLGRDYRLQPTQDPVFSTENPRTTVPDAVGGNLKVAAFNVLNYFTTLDTGADICGPLGDQGCRGANTASEFIRQRDKIITALVAIDADVVGLIEIENHPGDVPTADLVSGLNDVLGAGTYDYVATGAIGDDAIRVGLIYKPARVSLVDGFEVLDDPAFTDPLGYGEEKSRPALAQTFMDINTGGVFTAVVNHLKSKGSACGPGDDDLEQGNCNLTRALGAQALVDWLVTDPTGSGDPDMIILGDLNAYAMEDPIRTLEDNGFTNLVKVKALNGDYAYSYTFDGMVGTLDYSLVNSSLASQVTSATIWHINTDEPAVIDYDENFNPPGYYSSDAYRSSDHDPVVIGLEMTTEQEVNELIDAVQALVDDGTLNGGQGNALASKLENVLAKLAKENFNAAANQLNAFINQVEDFVNGGVLTAEQGDALIKAATALVGVLSD